MATAKCPGSGEPVEPYAVIGIAAWAKCPRCGERMAVYPDPIRRGYCLPKHDARTKR